MRINKSQLSASLIFLLPLFTLLIMTGCKKEIQQPANHEEATISSAAAPQAEANPGISYVPNQVLVKFIRGLSENQKAAVLARVGGQVEEKILTKTMQRFGDNDGIYLVHTPLAALEAISKIRGTEIIYAEPNYIYTHDATSNDPYFTNGSLWGMNGTYGSNAAMAWANNHTGSSTVYVGVIDEGAMFTHDDLAANFWTNPFDPVDGVDNDGNGYIDDIHGWDFDGNNNTTFDGSSDDHGTHVAGTIGAVGGNGTGVVGVNWYIKMISAKFLGNNGGTTANAIKAVDYITDLKIRHGLNIPATNNSWGGGGFSQALKDAIDRAGVQNILFVAAAGNNSSNNDSSPSYPASYSSTNIIAVASITSTGALSSFSNYGATSVDIGAPGSGIYSTLPVRKGNKIISGYGSYSGTSMATPHVTGGCALYASTHPGASAADIKNAILSNATPTASLSGKCVTGGRLNVGSF